MSLDGKADEQKNAPELPIGRFLKSKSPGGNRVILSVRGLWRGVAMVDWTSLRHAYGAANDVPALLNSLTPDPADEVWGELWSRICHQGSVYSASFAALPALADAAARWQPKQRAQPLALAGCILSSEDCRDKDGRNLVEAFFQENSSVVRWFQELCQESLAQAGLSEGDFIYLLQAARSFDGDEFWGRKLDQLAGGEF